MVELGAPRIALEIAADIAKEMGARVTGFHGAGGAPYGYYGESMFIDERSYAKAERAFLATGEQHVAQIAKAARRACRCNRWWHAPGRPTRAFLDAARGRKCDVIFMASHGHRGLKGLLLGSVTQQVLTHSKVPWCTAEAAAHARRIQCTLGGLPGA